MRQILNGLTVLMMTASFAALAQDSAPAGNAPTGSTPSAPAKSDKKVSKKGHHKKADKKTSTDSSKQ